MVSSRMGLRVDPPREDLARHPLSAMPDSILVLVTSSNNISTPLDLHHLPSSNRTAPRRGATAQLQTSSNRTAPRRGATAQLQTSSREPAADIAPGLHLMQPDRRLHKSMLTRRTCHRPNPDQQHRRPLEGGRESPNTGTLSTSRKLKPLLLCFSRDVTGVMT